MTEGPWLFPKRDGPDGAICVRKPRIPELISLDALLAACPARLAGHVGDDCREADFIGSIVPLILNRS
jgi:hypothetical protein